MPKVPYKKPALPITDQIAKLKSRGLVFSDVSFAEEFLTCVNYYRLSGYSLAYEQDHALHTFKQGTTFEDLVLLYNFDKKLRSILFEGISCFEVSLRTQWAYQVGMNLGAHAYTDPVNAIDLQKYKDNLDAILTEYKRSSELFVKHFQNTYQETLPPVWVACEVLSLGTLSRLYKNLAYGKAKNDIARFYGIDVALLESWVHCITVLRNHCAHQSRLVNKNFSISPLVPKSKKLQIRSLWLNSKKAYNLILLLCHLVSKISIDKCWKTELVSFLKKEATFAEKFLDFPHDWYKDPFWN